jgi:hypothetical protein
MWKAVVLLVGLCLTLSTPRVLNTSVQAVCPCHSPYNHNSQTQTIQGSRTRSTEVQWQNAQTLWSLIQFWERVQKSAWQSAAAGGQDGRQQSGNWITRFLPHFIQSTMLICLPIEKYRTEMVYWRWVIGVGDETVQEGNHNKNSLSPFLSNLIH